MEALILYFVLFFPGVYTPFGAAEAAAAVPFSVLRELGRTLTYTVPSLALLWYIVSINISREIVSVNETVVTPASPFDRNVFFLLGVGKPQKRDFFPFVIGLPGLILVSVGVSALAVFFSKYTGTVPSPKIEGPVNAAGWVVVIFSCLGTGYLEESYFRYYLLNWLENQIPRRVIRIVLSVILFAACHVYEGPWGILNAVLAGVFLSVIFIRWNSLHGIAWAHGAYNIFVYVYNGFFGA